MLPVLLSSHSVPMAVLCSTIPATDVSLQQPAENKDLLDIKINKDKSYMISWYSWCTSIADYIEANSPYRLEDTAIDSPNSIRCVSTTIQLFGLN